MSSIPPATPLRHLRKTLKIIIASVFALLLVLALMLSWLVFTESGTRQLFSTLARYQVLSYQSLQGSISDGLTIEALQINTETAEISITELSLLADWSELLYSKVLINELSAHNVTIQLTGDNTDTAESEDLNLDFLDDRLVFIPLKIDLEQLSIHQLVFISGDQSHSIDDIKLSSLIDQRGISATKLSLHYQQSNLQLQGSFTLAPKLAIDMDLEWSTILPDETPLQGVAQLKGNTKQLTLHHRSSGSLQSDIDISVSNWRQHPQLSLQGSVAKLAWPLTSDAPPQLTDLKIRAEGDITAVQAHINGQLTLESQNQSPFEIQANITPTQLDISQLKLTDGQNGTATVSAQLSWLEGILRWQALASLDKFDGQFVHPLLPEQLAGTLNIEGSYQDRLTLNIASNKLQGVLQKRAFEAQVNAQVENENILIHQLQARVGDNQLALSGSVEESNLNINFNGQLADLNAILPGTKGSLQTDGLLTGTLEEPTLKAQLQGQQLNLYDFSASDIRLTIDLQKGVFVNTGNQLKAENLRYQALFLNELLMTAQGPWQQPVLRLDTQSPLLQVTAQTELDLRQQGTIAGRLEQLELKGKTIGDWQLQQPVSYQAASPVWSLTELCLHNNGGRACVEASGTATELQANLSVRQLPLSLLNATELLTTPITGLLDIEANIAGDINQYQGQLSITQSRADTPVLLTANDDSQTQITIAGLESHSVIKNGTLNGSFSAQLNDTGSLSSEFEIAQLFTDHSPLQARIDYKIPDLQPYALLIPEVDALSGELEGTVTFTNSLQKPQLSLFTRLHVPNIYINSLGIEWTDLNAEITTLSGSQQQIKASLTAGEGQLNLNGTLEFESADNWLSELHIKGKNALLMDQPDRRILASPDMHITTTADSLSIAGRLRIPEAKLKIKSSPNRLELTSDAVIHTEENENYEEAAPYQFNLNLAVLLGDKVNLEAYGLVTDVTGQLTLTKQSPAALLGHGELNLINGSYQAYGQDLVIDRGVIRFTGLLSKPEIEMTASRTVSNVKAGLHVNGQIDDLRTRLYSEPALPDTEILSYIIRGKPMTGANASDQNALGNALLSYSIGQTTPITSKLTELSGLDEIGLEAEEGVESLGFTLGKYITPRLYARYGIGIVDKFSKVFLQYQLSDKFYLETESGQGQSVDLMYRSR